MNAPSKRAMRLFPRKNHVKTVAAARSGRFKALSVDGGALRRLPRTATKPLARSAGPATPTRIEVSRSDQETPGLSAALRTVIEELPPSEITEFIETVTGAADDGLDATLWGPPPSTTETMRAHLVNLAAKYADRQAVLAQSITRAEAAQLLGISNQAVSDRLAAGDLVGLKDGRVWKLPAWQFDADSENGWIPGIAGLRKHFPAGPVTLTAWVTAPNVDLGDRTPAARLAAGDVDDVLKVAQAGGPTAW
jgi:hypothetical protein